jgi:hypothetical protein
LANRRFFIPRDELYQKYIVEKMGASEIGKLYGCSGKPIFNALKEYDIPIRLQKRDKSFKPFCLCGCGLQVASYNAKYILGHQNLGKPARNKNKTWKVRRDSYRSIHGLTEEHKKKLSFFHTNRHPTIET